MTRRPTAEPTVRSVREFWEAHVNNELYTRRTRGSEAYFREIERRRYGSHYHLRRLFRELEGSSGRLLEIGCGMGMDTIRLARCGFDVTAVDLTESALEVARSYAEARGAAVDFRLGNAESLEFEDASFDAAYSFGVLHHTPNIEAAVAELHRVLRPRGTAYVMLYHRRSLVDLIHRLFRLPYESPRDLKDHCPVVYTFTESSARRLFQAFERVEVSADYPFTHGFRYLTFWTPEALKRWLGRRIGWHLMIRAVK